ncbi:MAG TPA: hypothetical protein VGK22_16765 [Candidatus Angelobacter sp.]|jgi:hypothetical protein
MPAPNIIEFERLVRAYVAGEASWDTVHEYAVEMEWANATDFPVQLRKPLDALHMAFLATDENDDLQFRLDRSEISKLISDLDQAQAKKGNI